MTAEERHKKLDKLLLSYARRLHNNIFAFDLNQQPSPPPPPTPPPQPPQHPSQLLIVPAGPTRPIQDAKARETCARKIEALFQEDHNAK